MIPEAPEPHSVFDDIVVLTAMRRTVPCVLDTNVLAFDVIQCAKLGRTTALLDAARSGSGPLFAAAHIHGETRRLLERRASQIDVEPAALFAVWNQRYRQVVRFVHVPPAQSDERLSAVAARDPDDEPTARLAMLIAPSYLLSRDRALIDVGLATPEALGVAIALRFTGLVDTAMLGSAGVVTVSGVATASGIRFALRHPRISLAVVALLAAAGLRWREPLAARLPGTLARSRVAGEQVLEAVTQLLVEEQRATQRVKAKLIGASDQTPLAQVASTVARATWPSTMRALSETTGMGVPDVRALLSAHDAFQRQGQRWQLGSVGAPF